MYGSRAGGALSEWISSGNVRVASGVTSDSGVSPKPLLASSSFNQLGSTRKSADRTESNDHRQKYICPPVASALRPAGSPRMDEWAGRVAVVTGANSGIGRAIAKKLLNHRLNVVAMDKNTDNLMELVDSCEDECGPDKYRLHPLNVDLCNDEDVRKAFKTAEMLGGVDVLINNAGVSGRTSLLDGDTLEWRCMLDVNIVALCLCTKEAVASMRKRNVNRGQIINISSNLSSNVPRYAPFHFYAATKHAVQALTEGYRQELVDISHAIRISSICPGLVKTGILKASLGEKMDEIIYSKHPYLAPEDIASTVEFIMSTPQHVQIHDLTVKPTGSEN